MTTIEKLADDRAAMLARLTEQAIQAYREYVWALHNDAEDWERGRREGEWHSLHRVLHEEASRDRAERERSDAV